MIRYVDPDKWRVVLILAAAGGFVAGAVDPLVRWLVSALGLPPHFGSWISAGYLTIGTALALAIWYPLLRIAAAAALLACASYIASVSVMHGLILGTWGFWPLIGDLLIVMCLVLPMCVAIIWFSLLASPADRKVGFDPRERCEACGYLLTGLPEPRCPECGRPFDPSLLGNVEGDG